MSQHLTYRKDIDGLRAIAVLAVVFFHADIGPPGGYVGVDIFFVISGYLITSLLWKDLESGQFSLSNFWERRARRIAPALIMVTIASLIAGYFILLPIDLLNLGKAAVSQALIAANFFYWMTSGYFAGEASEKPLLHTWSLAVEEQFYLIMPVLLWAIYKIKVLRRRGMLCGLIAAGFSLSLGMSVYALQHGPDAAFYLLPFRAWELLVGSYVALLPSSLLPQRGLLRELSSLLGVGMVVYSMVFYTKATIFPGTAALLPCLGAALLIWAHSPTNCRLPFTGVLLSTQPFVFVGLISYSLYLWHWPFLAFGKYSGIAPLAIDTRLALIVAGFVCAVLSWRFIETPFRTRRVASTSRSIFLAAGGGLAATLATGLLLMAFHGYPQRFSEDDQHLADAKLDSDFIPDLSSSDVGHEKLFTVGAARAGLLPTVFVWGDSHAKAIMPALDEVLKSRGIAGRAALRSSTAPVLGWCKPTSPDSPEVMSYNEAVFNYIQDHHIWTVVLAAKWRSYARIRPDPNARVVRAFEAALLSTIRKLQSAGCHVWVLLDVPYQNFEVPRAVSRPIFPRSYIDSLCTTVAETDALDCIDPKIVSKIQSEGTRLLDPKPLFLDPTGRFYMVQIGPTVLYCDHDHLTRSGAKKLLKPFFETSLTFGLPRF